MNPSEVQIESQEPDFVVAKGRPEENSAATQRIELSEFENLLQRAMDILSMRAQSAAQSIT